MKARWIIVAGLGAAGLAASAEMLSPHLLRVAVQKAASAVTPPSLPETRRRPALPEAERLIRAAEAQVGVTLSYDPAYTALAYPGGDVPRARGVCTDVVIRALRDGLGIDLQEAIHRDMGAAFSAYPSLWGLPGPDANIDHRRVPNIETFLTRLGAARPVGATSGDFQPGDIVTSRLPGKRPHIMIVTDRVDAAGEPLVVHNIGAGTRVEARLFEYPLSGQFRLTPEAIGRLQGRDGT